MHTLQSIANHGTNWYVSSSGRGFTPNTSFHPGHYCTNRIPFSVYSCETLRTVYSPQQPLRSVGAHADLILCTMVQALSALPILWAVLPPCVTFSQWLAWWMEIIGEWLSGLMRFNTGCPVLWGSDGFCYYVQWCPLCLGSGNVQPRGLWLDMWGSNPQQGF